VACAALGVVALTGAWAADAPAAMRGGPGAGAEQVAVQLARRRRGGAQA
jgi:hypothetical protein